MLPFAVLEKFMKEKVDEKLKAEASLESQVAGAPATRVLIEVDQNKVEQKDTIVVGLVIPIPQVDGLHEDPDPDQLFYSFVSDYHQDDIEYCLDEELFPAKNATLVSCVAPRPRQSADQQCIIAMRRIAGQEFRWPDMKEDQVPVFGELKPK